VSLDQKAICQSLLGSCSHVRHVSHVSGFCPYLPTAVMTRLEKLLGISLALVVIGGLLSGLWIWQQRQLETRLQSINNLELLSTSAQQSELVALGMSIRAFGLAHASAADWHSDAKMITGLNSWSEISSSQDLEKSVADGWQYVFYSESTGEAATFSVGSDARVSQSQTYSVNGQLIPRPPSEWQIRDDEAIAIFLDNGGREFMEQEDTVYMTMQLSTIAGGNRIEWLIAAVADNTGNSFTMWIDANTGDIVNTLVVEE